MVGVALVRSCVVTDKRAHSTYSTAAWDFNGYDPVPFLQTVMAEPDAIGRFLSTDLMYFLYFLIAETLIVSGASFAERVLQASWQRLAIARC